MADAGAPAPVGGVAAAVDAAAAAVSTTHNPHHHKHLGGHLGGKMAKIHFANLTHYSWNIFRYIGDYLHLLGILVLLVTIAKNESVAGISRGTQILYCLIFCTRYLDLLDHGQSEYLVMFKVTFILTSFIVLACFKKLENTYSKSLDTCNILIIIVPCFIAALIVTDSFTVLEVLWSFSELLEGFAMVPQYILCYRERQVDWAASMYVICLGGYRVFYALNWIYKKIEMPHYSDPQSWIGGAVEIIFFADYLNYRYTGYSFLRTLVLTVDTKINDFGKKAS